MKSILAQLQKYKMTDNLQRAHKVLCEWFTVLAIKMFVLIFNLRHFDKSGAGKSAVKDLNFMVVS